MRIISQTRFTSRNRDTGQGMATQAPNMDPDHTVEIGLMVEIGVVEEDTN